MQVSAEARRGYSILLKLVLQVFLILLTWGDGTKAWVLCKWCKCIQSLRMSSAPQPASVALCSSIQLNSSVISLLLSDIKAVVTSLALQDFLLCSTSSRFSQLSDLTLGSRYLTQKRLQDLSRSKHSSPPNPAVITDPNTCINLQDSGTSKTDVRSGQ